MTQSRNTPVPEMQEPPIENVPRISNSVNECESISFRTPTANDIFGNRVFPLPKYINSQQEIGEDDCIELQDGTSTKDARPA